MTLPDVPLLNRENAILEFNRRVLAQAQRVDVPLLERLRYICIVSSNLDEFFEVRFADMLDAQRDGSGLVLVWKQMPQGSFRWPPVMDGVMRLSAVEFAALFDGLDWTRVQTRRGIPAPTTAA